MISWLLALCFRIFLSFESSASYVSENGFHSLFLWNARLLTLFGVRSAVSSWNPPEVFRRAWFGLNSILKVFCLTLSAYLLVIWFVVSVYRPVVLMYFVLWADFDWLSKFLLGWELSDTYPWTILARKFIWLWGLNGLRGFFNYSGIFVFLV